MKGFKKNIAIVVFLFMSLACENDSGDGIPSRLSVVIDEIEHCGCLPYINEYLWKGQTVYVLAFAGPMCMWIPSFYNSDGIKFEMPEGYNYNHFVAESKLVRRVWTCESDDGAKSELNMVIDEAQNCNCLPYVNEYLWKGEVVYVLAYAGPACDWFPSFYDAAGSMFDLPDGYDYDRFIDNSQFVRRVWTCEG